MVIKEWMVANPKLSVIVLAFLVTLVMTLVTKFLTNQPKMRELKDKQKQCQINLKSFPLGSEDALKVQKEMMACTMELMKHSFKPILISFIPLILFFWWIRGVYSTVLSGWIWWYIPAGIISSIILRKILKVV
ncbi:MAG TPA: EMC3/TMCO1 family protein [Candidatus Nanoarchaeia archaeon]|nr:EMC3/TMCO1 family protein [Candidatus Nanoarchaeia archaeon]